MAAKAQLTKEEWQFLAELKQYVRTQGEAFLADPNINSVGIGFKVKDGQRTEELSVQFTVGRKGRSQPEMEALMADISTTPIPEVVVLPSGTIKTDVLERTFKPAFQLVAERQAVKEPRKQRLDVIVPGVSVGHPKTTAGTAGTIVFDRRTGDPCVLSNWHVLHTAQGKIGDPMLQPGPYDDDSTSRNRAGTLVRSHLGHAGDCAIARIEGRGFAPDIVGLDGVKASQIARPDLHDRVIKSGRTTGVTHGIVRRVETIATINYGTGFEDTIIGCFEIGPDTDLPAPGNEISKGGDSGSVWLVAEGASATDVMVGLHFGGETDGNADEHALACYIPAVFEKLEISLDPPTPSAPVFLEAVGAGFDVDFLAQTVSFPEPSTRVAQDVLVLDDGRSLIPYTHFTVCMSASRRMARYVAWNIDGARMRQAKRTGFRFDRRVPDEQQIGNDAYQDNKLDRGHIARRADVIWGGKTEAEQANYDSCYYTNIAPQHQAFNQSDRAGLWGLLENAIYEDVDVENLRVSVMGGPILRDNDRRYEDIKIPRSYWKLIAYVDEADKVFKARAYVLSQDDLLHDIEALELDEFRLYQVSLLELEERTGLMFPDLHTADTFESIVGPEGVQPSAREVKSRAEVIV